MQKLIFWELNEINFDLVLGYIEKGHLPHFNKFIKQHGLSTTSSESKYEILEPWIQWPTIRSGLTYDEHKVFRLGDIENSDIKQHWEIVEKHGFSVATVSPINGYNRSINSPFWIPDPWVDTKVSGKNPYVYRIADALRQTVNDNAQGKLEFKSILALLEVFLLRISCLAWAGFFRDLIGTLKRQHWSKALILDRLLSEMFIKLWKQHQPDFSTLFLNGGAHIQHHYFFNSSEYRGKNSNPQWYVKPGADPVLDILKLYDQMLDKLLKLKNTRLMVATGLRQLPYEKTVFYWRLKDHASFLRKLQIPFVSIHPRMTRDFLIKFATKQDMAETFRRLKSAVTKHDQKPLFGDFEEQDTALFVTLTYPHDLSNGCRIIVDSVEYDHFEKDVVFVAIKNGHHDAKGYYIDSMRRSNGSSANIPIKDVFGFVLDHFGIKKEQIC